MKILFGALKRLLAGVALIIPMTFIALIICLFSFGLDFPPTGLQSALLGLGAVSGFLTGVLWPGVAGGALVFILSVFSGGNFDGGANG